MPSLKAGRIVDPSALFPRSQLHGLPDLWEAGRGPPGLSNFKDELWGNMSIAPTFTGDWNETFKDTSPWTTCNMESNIQWLRLSDLSGTLYTQTADHVSLYNFILNFGLALDPQKPVVRKNPSEEANTALVVTGFSLLKSQQKSKSWLPHSWKLWSE